MLYKRPLNDFTYCAPMKRAERKSHHARLRRTPYLLAFFAVVTFFSGRSYFRRSRTYSKPARFSKLAYVIFRIRHSCNVLIIFEANLLGVEEGIFQE